MLLATGFGVACTMSQALIPAAVGRALDLGLIPRDRRALVLWASVVLLLGVVQALTGMVRDRGSTANRLGASYLTTRLLVRKSAELGTELPGRVSTGAVVGAGSLDVGGWARPWKGPPGGPARWWPSRSWRCSCWPPPGAWGWWSSPGYR